MKHRICGILLAVSLLGWMLGGCAAQGDAGPSGALPQGSAQSGGYQAPPMAQASFDPEAARGEGACLIDASHAAQGYVAASAQSEKRLKFQIKHSGGGLDYAYDLPGDGTPIVCPLQSGDGEYRLRIMEQVSDGKYVEIYARTEQVRLEDEFQPYLRPSCYVDYSADSASVELAAELAVSAADSAGVVAAVYDYVVDTIRYDQAKAESVGTGYLSDPDATLDSGKGICVDYAVLVAAMLRSQGIPTKVITGYVAPNDLYHAWNMVWLEEEGWITVELKVDPENWNRVDATFVAGGAGSEFVGDGSNYRDYRTY